MAVQRDWKTEFENRVAWIRNLVESAGVKTTGMGSMFRLSYKVRMKDPAQEKELIDALRTRNANLEISLLPWSEPQLSQL